MPLVECKIALNNNQDKNQQNNREYDDTLHNPFIAKSMVWLEPGAETCVENPREAKSNHNVESVATKCV